MALARDIIYDFLKAQGIRCLFGLPGTNEAPFIDPTVNPETGVEYIQCLHENIAVGAAMGYARMTGKAGVVQLHVTPGVGHGIGNLFNAFKSRVPLVILCGQQHTDLLLQEPLLASDLVQVARQYTKWSHELRSADELPQVLQRAFKLATTPPTGPVFLALPWNLLLEEASPVPGKVTRIGARYMGDAGEVGKAAAIMARAQRPLIVAGDGVGYSEAWAELEELARVLGAPVYSETQSSMMNYRNGDYHWQGELPGAQDQWQQIFGTRDVAFLCGFNAQAQLVVYQYKAGPLIPSHVTQVYLHNDPWEIGKNYYGEAAILGDIKTTLPAIVKSIAAHPDYSAEAARKRDEALQQSHADFTAEWGQYSAQSGEFITASDVSQAIAALNPAHLVYAHEVLSDSAPFQKNIPYPTPTSYYATEGGSLGYSMPATLGIALASREQGVDRTIINGVGDGSALFYPHTWWTARKYGLPILHIIMNNREYETLIIGLGQVEQYYPQFKPIENPPPYLLLGQPEVNFHELAVKFSAVGSAYVTDPNPDVLKKAILMGIETARERRGAYVLELRYKPFSTSLGQPRLDFFFSHLFR